MSIKQDDPPEPPKRPKRKPKGDYEVGYCRPPQKHQFQKDQPSRNPKGRPRQRVASGNILERVSDDKIAYIKGGKRQKATLYELFLTRVMDDAVKGDRKAQTEFLSTCQRVLRAKKRAAASEAGLLGVSIIADGLGTPVPAPDASTAPRTRSAKSRAAESAIEMFDRLAGRLIPVRDGDVRKRMTYEQAIARSVYAGAVKGDPKAWKLISRFVDIDVLNPSSRMSDIIDENGVLKVRINLGKLPEWGDGIDDDDDG